MYEEINGHDIVVRIDNCLEGMDLSREVLANHIGKQRQCFTDWKNRNIMPNAKDLYMISKFLGVPLEYLLTGNEKIMDDKTAVIAAKINALDPTIKDALITMMDGQIEYWKKQEK